MMETNTKMEYRIVKNARRFGQRYLLQEGRWDDHCSPMTGRVRRVFRYCWEQEFATKSAAVQRLAELTGK
jgi:hypothetical protein